MRRVAILGPSGAGKSTLARHLGEILGIEVVHLDKLYWRPGWVEPPEEEFRASVIEAVLGEAWVIDGNYRDRGAGAERLAACDTIIFMDFPRRVCLWQVFGRIVRTYGRVRPDMGEGCPEQFDWEFVKWVWDTPKRRPSNVATIDAHRATKRVIDLRSRREVARFLRAVEKVGSTTP
jgi:adenylate kinase family enzyme